MFERVVSTRAVLDSPLNSHRKKMLLSELRSKASLIDILNREVPSDPSKFRHIYSDFAHTLKPAIRLDDTRMLRFAEAVALAWVHNPVESFMVARDSSIYSFFGPEMLALLRSISELSAKANGFDAYMDNEIELDIRRSNPRLKKCLRGPVLSHVFKNGGISIDTPPVIFHDEFTKKAEDNLEEITRRLIIGCSPWF